MSDLDKLNLTIRQTPLLERLEQAQRMISKMCAKGRCPEMSVPVQATDEDVFITLALSDAIKLIEQLNFEINAVSFYFDMERKKLK